jgi:hypothetical protein
MQDAKIDNHGLVVRRLNSRIETSDFSCQAQRQNDKIKEPAHSAEERQLCQICSQFF